MIKVEASRLLVRDRPTVAEQFDELVAAYEKRIFNLAFRMLGNHEDAADITQDTFIKAYRAFKGFRGDSSVYTWLYRIAVNCCKNRLRERERPGRSQVDSLDHLRDDEQPDQREIPDWTYSPGPVFERQELRQTVHQAIQGLPPDYRVVIILRDLQGLSYKEIAQVLQVPVETVKTRIFRGRSQLRERLADYVAT